MARRQTVGSLDGRNRGADSDDPERPVIVPDGSTPVNRRDNEFPHLNVAAPRCSNAT